MSNASADFIRECVVPAFDYGGRLHGYCEYGNGHINDTYLLTTEGGWGGKYVLQRINTYVFKDPLALMRNIKSVTDYLRRGILAEGGDPDRETLNIIPARDGKCYFVDENGGFWRSYAFIDNAACRESVSSPDEFYQCGRGFGRFQSLLSGYPAAELVESIPHFHNTARRFTALCDAVAEDALGRVALCAKEVSFAMERGIGADTHVRMLELGELPLRVTHNDTKCNNVLLDVQTGEAVCVLDLDTVMPGLSVNDFGDAIRYGANTAAEDCCDLDAVSLSLPLFEGFARGFLDRAGETLTRAEIDALAPAARLMTLECGMRFLTDFLQGDVYFKIRRPQHNLDRCRNQFALVLDMERKMDRMAEAVARNACV